MTKPAGKAARALAANKRAIAKTRYGTPSAKTLARNAARRRRPTL